MGVRKDGITLVDDVGGSGPAVPVEITEPIGSQPQADSVSVTPSSNTTVTGTFTNPLDTVSITIPEGYNSLYIKFTNWGAGASFNYFVVGGEYCNKVFRLFDFSYFELDSGAYVPIPARPLDCVIPVVSGQTITFEAFGVTAPSMGITLIASMTAPFAAPLTLEDLQNTIINVAGTVIVTATDLDIRNLVFATDKVDVSGSSVSISGAVAIAEPVTVDAVNLDIRDLAFATDKVDVSGSTVTANVTPTQEDLDAFVAGTTKAIPTEGVFDDSLAAVSTGQSAVPRITSRRALHTNLRDSSTNEIGSDDANTVGLTGSKKALYGLSVLAKRNQDGTVSTWIGETGFSTFASNPYPFIKALRSSIYSIDTNLNAPNAQASIDIQERSVESIAVFLRNSSLLGTVSFLPTPGGNNQALQIYNTRTRTWEFGIIVNPTIDTLYMVPVAGLSRLDVRVTVYTSGSLLCSMSGGPGVSATYAEVSGSIISTKTPLLGTTAPAAVAVGVASGLAVAANANRKGLILTNTSVNNISLGFGANAAVLNAGITIFPASRWEMNEYTYSQEAINAIAAGAASNLAIQELL